MAAAARLTIVGLGGSMAKVSRSRAALLLALEGAASAGVETDLLDIRELNLPMYNPDEDVPTEAAMRLIESCHAADGMIWASPMYQGTVSGALKNALDWLHVLRDRDPPFLHDKVIGLLSAAGGTQGLQAINTMEFSVGHSGAGRCPTSSPSRQRHTFSTRMGGSGSRPSRCSSRPSESRLFASARSSRPTVRFTARPNATRRLNGWRPSGSQGW